MLKTTIIFALILLLYSCKFFKDTEHDYNIKSKFNADNIVFNTNTKFYYSNCRIKGLDTIPSIFINFQKDTLLVKNEILTVIPGKFLGQTKMKWELTDFNDSIILKSFSGIVEDINGVWIHPIRDGFPFIYSESAPFPEIKFPIENNLSWKAGLTGLKGYEKIGLTGTVSFEYNVIGKSDIKTKNIYFKDCWKIESIGKSILGTSEHTFYFHEKYGFVYSEYKFPNGEKLILELIDQKGKAL